MRNKPNKKPEQEPEASRSIVIEPDPNGIKIKDLKKKSLNELTEEERAELAARLSAISSEVLSTVTEPVREITGRFLQSIENVLKSSIDPDVLTFLIDNADAAVENEEELQELMPYIRKALKQSAKDPAYSNISIDDIINDNIELSQFSYIMQTARELKAEHDNLVRYPLQPQYELEKISKNNSTLITYIQDKDIIGKGAFDMPVAKMSKTEDITAYTCLEFREDNGIYQKIKNLSEYEIQVLDVIGSVKKFANENNMPCIIDGYIIGSRMPGDCSKISENTAEEINQIIEKLRHLFIEVDCTDEFIKRSLIQDGETFKFNDYCLSARGIEYRTRTKQIRKGYLLTALPLPLEYAEMTKEVISIPVKCFNVKAINADNSISETPIKMSKERRAITSYILRRIFVMRNDWIRATDSYKKYMRYHKDDPDAKNKTIKDFCKQEHVISFETVYKKIGIEPDKHRALDIRKFCDELLKYQKAIGVISDYDIPKIGKSYPKIRIILNK